jgi:hypothetical protein
MDNDRDRSCHVSSRVLSIGMSKLSCDGRVNRMYRTNAYRAISDRPPRVQTATSPGRLTSSTNIVIVESCTSCDHQRGGGEGEDNVSNVSGVSIGRVRQ